MVKDALGLGQRRVQAVAELVGHRQHVSAASREIEQHVGVDARDRVGAEGPAAFVGPHRGIDPAPIEEPLRDVPASDEKALYVSRTSSRACA